MWCDAPCSSQDQPYPAGPHAKLNVNTSKSVEQHNNNSLLNYHKMAAVIKSLNAKIRSHPYLNYVCSTRKFNLSQCCES